VARRAHAPIVESSPGLPGPARPPCTRRGGFRSQQVRLLQMIAETGFRGVIRPKPARSKPPRRVQGGRAGPGKPGEGFDDRRVGHVAPTVSGCRHRLQLVEILAPLLEDRLRVVEVSLVQLFDEGRVGAEEIRIERNSFMALIYDRSRFPALSTLNAC